MRRVARHGHWPSWSAGWCVVFAGAHLYWAVGGSVGLASSAGPGLASRRPREFVVLGLYGVAAVLLLGTVLALVRPVADRGQRLVAAMSAVIAAALLLRGVGVEAALALDAGGVREAVGSTEMRASLWWWNPWFVFGGILWSGRAREEWRRGRMLSRRV